MIKPIKNIFLLFLIAYLFGNTVKAQQINNSIEPSRILMGEPVD